MFNKALMALAVACAVLSVSFARAGEGGDFAKKKIGGMEVVALMDAVGMTDATLEEAQKLLIGMGEADLERGLKPGALVNSINAFVVRLDGRTILFDTGLPLEGGKGGIQPALKAAGIAVTDIDAIVITHFHYDHVGGLMDGKKPVFPRAELYVPRVEVDKWSDAGTDFLLAYNVRTNAFEANREILPGVTSLAAYGHTPGHTIFRLESDGGKLLIIGDLIHVPGVQLANPDIAITYDMDPVAAVASRKRVFEAAAREKMPIAAMHIPFPGMGILVREGDGYVFNNM